MSTTHNKSQEVAEEKISISSQSEGKNSTSTILTAGMLSSPIKVAPSRRM